MRRFRESNTSCDAQTWSQTVSVTFLVPRSTPLVLEGEKLKTWMYLSTMRERPGFLDVTGCAWLRLIWCKIRTVTDRYAFRKEHRRQTEVTIGWRRSQLHMSAMLAIVRARMNSKCCRPARHRTWRNEILWFHVTTSFRIVDACSPSRAVSLSGYEAWLFHSILWFVSAVLFLRGLIMIRTSNPSPHFLALSTTMLPLP